MRPTILHVGGTLRWVINTRNPDTMVLKDADSTPTITVRKNGSATGDSVTITKRAATTGIYDCEYNPAGDVEGDVYNIRESVAMTGTTTAQATYEFSWPVTVVALERGTTPFDVWQYTIGGQSAETRLIDAANFAEEAATSVQSLVDAQAAITDILGTPAGDSLADDIAAIEAGGGGATQETLLAVKAKTDLITSQTSNQLTLPSNTLTIIRGDSFSQSVPVTTNYTGYTATFTIRHRVTNAVLTTASATVTSSTVLTVALTTSETAFALLVDATEFGPHPYDIQLVNGSVRKTEKGVAIIQQDVTT